MSLANTIFRKQRIQKKSEKLQLQFRYAPLDYNLSRSIKQSALYGKLRTNAFFSWTTKTLMTGMTSLMSRFTFLDALRYSDFNPNICVYS